MTLRRLLTALCLAVLAAPLPAPAQQSGAFDYRLAPQQIAPDVYVFVGLDEDFSTRNGGNIVNTGFIVARDGIIVIDTGSSRRYGEQMLAAIRRVSDKPVVLALNTHHHPDHFLGNQAFPPGALAALDPTRQGIRQDGEAFNENLYRLAGDWMKGTERIIPDATVAPGRRTVAGRDLEFMSLGGHTEADLILIDHDSGTIFAGDLLFHNRAPTTPHADLPRWLNALERLERIPAKRWVPGHGKVSTDTRPIRQTRAWLQWLQRTMREGAESGLDMNDMLARPVPTEFHDLALAQHEYRRSVIHLFPAAEQAALRGPDAK